MPQEHNHAIIGVGIAGTSAAWELLAHGKGIGNPSGGDIAVTMFEQQSPDQLFNRKSASKADFQPSSSSYGARSVRLAGDHNQVNALKIKASADLYKKVHELAISNGTYDKLIAAGHDYLIHEPIIQGQAYIDIANANDKQANERLDKAKESIAYGALINNAPYSAAISREDIPFADIRPPSPDSTQYKQEMEIYHGELLAFSAQYPQIGKNVLKSFESGEMPRILIERPWTSEHPERSALSLNTNSYMLVSQELLHELYPNQYRTIYDEVKNYDVTANGVAVNSANNGIMEFDDLAICAGPYMAESAGKTHIDFYVEASPYVEFRLPAGLISKDILPVLKGNALPENKVFNINLGDDKPFPITISTISRNGSHAKHGQKQTEIFKVQFKEKVPLEQVYEIGSLPSLNEVAKHIAANVADSYGILLDEHATSHAKGHWCPQTKGKEKATGQNMMFSGPVFAENINERDDNKLDISNVPPIHILGPGNGSGAQFLGGKADLLASAMQTRTHRLHDYGISNSEAYGATLNLTDNITKNYSTPASKVDPKSNSLFTSIGSAIDRLFGLAS